MEKGRYSFKMLIGSILAGLVFAVIGEVLYQALKGILPRVAMAEIYFVGLFLFLGLAIWLIGKTVYSRTYKGVPMNRWAILLVAMLALTAVFELLYEIEFGKKDDAYIFVIDCSASMSEGFIDINTGEFVPNASDPDGLRFKAIDNMLADKPDDFQYAVYLFGSEVVCAREMGPKSDDQAYSRDSNMGGTAIKLTLETIMADIKNKELDLSKLNAHVVFLSDGAPSTDDNVISDIYTEILPILEEYATEGISISTVGLLYSDADLMTLIADKTGGVFVNVDNVNDLEDAMFKAGDLGDARHLLGYRNSENLNLLYAIMRILFIIGLGVVIGLEKAVICEKFLDTTAVLKSSVVGSALAGICMEIGMNGLKLPSALIRVLACILISFTLLREDFLGRNDSGAEVRRGGR